ncbi:DUF4956 domain-containing protein [Clostridiaceae bacterium HSG29]|nr:DUF4956 domain-containing protein [Clostridiaceae bacterium HSG29]
MNFSDIFKSSFLEAASAVSILDMFIAIFLSFTMGVLIFMVYKKTYKGVMYSSNFGLLLISLPMITALVILAVTSNIVLSLGMVGALSIVRFRTAIKDPLDIAFLFWSIAVGIVLAAGLITLGVFGSLMIGGVMVLYGNRKSYDSPYILLITLNNEETENHIVEYIKQNVKKQIVKSKSVTNGTIELNYEVRLKNDSTIFINDLSKMDAVTNAVLVSYNGEFLG